MNIQDLREIAATMKRVGVDEDKIVWVTLDLCKVDHPKKGWHKITVDEYKTSLFTEGVKNG